MSDIPIEVIEGEKYLKELEKGPWPSHVKETRKTRYPLALYGASLYLKRDLWTTGGYVSVPGTPTGILMRVTSRPDIGESANVVRIFTPSGNFLTSQILDTISDFADRFGVGMVHAITTGHNIEIPGIPKERIREFVNEFRKTGLDVGSTGDAFRNTTSCVGQALCEYSGMNTLKFRDDFYATFGDYAKYPTFPHKIKVKASGCPLDCARCTQKADIGVLSTWEGAPEIINENMSKLSPEVLKDIILSCPTGAIEMNGGQVIVKGEDCVQCMKCVKSSSGAFMPGKNRKLAVYVGGKLRGKKGPLSSKLMLKLDNEQQVFELIQKLSETFADHAARKERLGDMLFRIGMKNFLIMMDTERNSYQVSDLRENVFFKINGEERKEAANMLRRVVKGSDTNE